MIVYEKGDVLITDHDLESCITSEILPYMGYSSLLDLSNNQFDGMLTRLKNSAFDGISFGSGRDIDSINVNRLFLWYQSLCQISNKVPSMGGFCQLLGMKTIVLYDQLKLNYPCAEIVKNMSEIRERALKNNCLDDKSVVGKLAIGNSEYAWNNYGIKPLHDQTVLSLDSIESLPLLDDLNNA